MSFKLPEIPPPRLIKALDSYNLLPAIIFVPSRRRCDEAATEVALDKSQRIDTEKQSVRQRIYDEFVLEHPEVKRHKHTKILLNSGIASHHAGHLPAWKLLIEKMMSAGLLNAIFATSTVAAGVDFPARTVVISNADTRTGDGWRPLQASELQQMTGRAGRRGKDNVGFVVLAPSNFQNPPRIASLLQSPPDDLQSQFRATYSSLLNLLDAFGGFDQLREIVEKSFAFRDTARRISGLERKMVEREKALIKKIHKSVPSLNLADVRGFERLTRARMRLEEKLPATRAEMRRDWLTENVRPGRIVTKGRSGKSFFLVISVHGEKVSAMRDDGKGATFPLSRVNRIYAKQYQITAKSAEDAFFDIHEDKNPPLKEPKLSAKKENPDEAFDLINSLIELFLPETGSKDEKTRTLSFLWESWREAEFLQNTERDIEILRNDIWLPFEHRARVLHEFDYLDFPSQQVTESGKWLADVRVDRPLLVGEALKQGLFEELEPKQIAGLMGALAADPDREYGELYLSDKILEVLTEFENTVFEVSNIEWKFGVEPAPEMNFSAAATTEEWAEGGNWSDLVRDTRAEEGDLVRLLSRTGEALMQIAALRETHPEAAQKAYLTAEIILREPIR
ncbi:MAG: helicase-related protein [Pyrinomonadaceae bacterium]